MVTRNGLLNYIGIFRVPFKVANGIRADRMNLPVVGRGGFQGETGNFRCNAASANLFGNQRMQNMHDIIVKLIINLAGVTIDYCLESGKFGKMLDR